MIQIAPIFLIVAKEKRNHRCSSAEMYFTKLTRVSFRKSSMDGFRKSVPWAPQTHALSLWTQIIWDFMFILFGEASIIDVVQSSGLHGATVRNLEAYLYRLVSTQFLTFILID
jgi:hypothetical protein